MKEIFNAAWYEKSGKGQKLYIQNEDGARRKLFLASEAEMNLVQGIMAYDAKRPITPGNTPEWTNLIYTRMLRVLREYEKQPRYEVMETDPFGEKILVDSRTGKFVPMETIMDTMNKCAQNS